MDSNAIEEIADKLGVGTDYLLNHLSEFASKWGSHADRHELCRLCDYDDCIGRVGVFVRKCDEVISRERRRLHQAVPTVHDDVGMRHRCDMRFDFSFRIGDPHHDAFDVTRGGHG